LDVSAKNLRPPVFSHPQCLVLLFAPIQHASPNWRYNPRSRPRDVHNYTRFWADPLYPRSRQPGILRLWVQLTFPLHQYLRVACPRLRPRGGVAFTSARFCRAALLAKSRLWRFVRDRGAEATTAVKYRAVGAYQAFFYSRGSQYAVCSRPLPGCAVKLRSGASDE